MIPLNNTRRTQFHRSICSTCKSSETCLLNVDRGDKCAYITIADEGWDAALSEAKDVIEDFFILNDGKYIGGGFKVNNHLAFVNSLKKTIDNLK